MKLRWELGVDEEMDYGVGIIVGMLTICIYIYMYIYIHYISIVSLITDNT